MGTADAASAAADSWEQLADPSDSSSGGGSLLQKQLARRNEAQLALMRADGLRLAPQTKHWQPKPLPLPVPGRRPMVRPLQPAAQRTQSAPAQAAAQPTAEPTAEAASSAGRAGEQPAQQLRSPSYRRLFPPAPRGKQQQQHALLPAPLAPVPEPTGAGAAQHWSAFIVPAGAAVEPAPLHAAAGTSSQSKRRRQRRKGVLDAGEACAPTGSASRQPPACDVRPPPPPLPPPRERSDEQQKEQRPAPPPLPVLPRQAQEPQQEEKPQQLWSAFIVDSAVAEQQQQPQGIQLPSLAPVAPTDELAPPLQQQLQPPAPPPLAPAQPEAIAPPAIEPGPALEQQQQQQQQPQLTNSQPGTAGGSRPGTAGGVNPTALDSLAGCLASSEPAEWAQRLQQQQPHAAASGDLSAILQQLERQRTTGSPTKPLVQPGAGAAAQPAAGAAAAGPPASQQQEQPVPAAVAAQPAPAPAPALRPSLPWSCGAGATETHATAGSTAAADGMAAATAKPARQAPDAAVLPTPRLLLGGWLSAAAQQPAAAAAAAAVTVGAAAPPPLPAAEATAPEPQAAEGPAAAEAWCTEDGAEAGAADLALEAAPDSWEEAADALGVDASAEAAALLAAPAPSPAPPPTAAPPHMPQLAMARGSAAAESGAAGAAAALAASATLEASEAPTAVGSQEEGDELDPLLQCLLPAPAGAARRTARPAAYRPPGLPGAAYRPPGLPGAGGGCATPAAPPQLPATVECLICFADVPPQALAACVPCGHSIMCGACVPDYLARARGECPLCRAELAGVQAGNRFLMVPGRWGRSVER